MELQVKIIGVLLITLSLVHIAFPRYFNWVKELSSVSLINRQMMYVHTFFIAFILILMGILCLTSADELINTTLGKKIALGIGVFWAARLLVQFFGYSPKLWWGRTFETIIHIVFSLLWTYLSIVFFLIYTS